MDDKTASGVFDVALRLAKVAVAPASPVTVPGVVGVLADDSGADRKRVVQTADARTKAGPAVGRAGYAADADH